MIFHDWVETELITGLTPMAWYQYQYGGSAGQIIYDSIGDKHIQCDVSGAPVLTENVLNGQPGWYFNGSSNPLVYSGAVEIKHAFVLASNEDATFATYQGLLTGETSGDVLVGDNGTTKFFNLGIDNVYTKEGVDFDESNQQAPMSGTFRLLEVKNTTGITLDGIQVGQQRSLTTRKWQGHFVEMILFDRILTATEVRRVRLYFNIKFGEHLRGLPLYFPSADITPTVGPSRFYDAPKDYDKITDTWEYEDGGKDFNEVAGDPPMRWEYAYPAVPKAQLPIYNEFWNTARLVNTFYFTDPDGNTWDNVRIEDYNRSHQAHMRWRHDVAYRLVGYNSTGTPPTPTVPPAIPTGLELAVISDSVIYASWDSPAEADVTAPSVPTMSAGDVLSDTEIDWSWSAASDDVAVTGYDLQIAEDVGFSTGLVTHNLGNVLAYSSTGLTASTTYYARVRAHDAVPNNSAYSSSVNATTDAPAATLPYTTGLYMWLNADDITGLVDGNTVTTWQDSSVANHDATQATSGFRPTYKTNILNGLPVVRFDGTAGNYLDLGNLSALTAAEVFIVVKIDTEPPASSITAGLWRVGTDADWTYFPFTDGSVYDDFGSTVRKSTGNPTDPLSSWAIYNVWSASADWGSEINGTAHFSTGTNTVGFATACYLGASDNGGFAPKFLDGDVAEFILYDHKLGGSDRTAVVTYLQTKYGI